MGRDLNADEYLNLYCGCDFCRGEFGEGKHPLDFLLEDQRLANMDRKTPTSRAIGTNTWPYLHARRMEIAAFSTRPAAEVIEADFGRAAALAVAGQASRLERLAEALRVG